MNDTGKGNEELYDTVLADDVQFDGESHSETDILVKGHYSGSLTVSGSVHVAPEARVTANIRAGTILVQGVVEGTVHASDHVELVGKGYVRGNVTAPKIIVSNSDV